MDMSTLLVVLSVFLTGAILGAYVSSAIAQHRMNRLLEDQMSISAKQEEISRYMAAMSTFVNLKEMFEEAETRADDTQQHLLDLHAMTEKLLGEDHTDWEIQRLAKQRNDLQNRFDGWLLERQVAEDLRMLYAEYIIAPMIGLLLIDADEDRKEQLRNRVREIYAKLGIDFDSADV